MFAIPPAPEVPDDQRAKHTVSLRYEDVAQDGRLLLRAVPHALGEVVWWGMLQKRDENRALAKQGVIPILSRLVVESFEGPTAVKKHLEGEGRFELAHTEDASGKVERILLNMWVDVFGERSRQFGPKPEGYGERVLLGRVYAEHVFTRLFAAPADRKVTKLQGMAREIPEAKREWRAPEALLDLPDDATPLDAELTDDPAPIVVGVGLTDSNQHVNSLVYPELFEEAAMRRFDAHRKKLDVQPTFVACAYRKPSFAGDRVRFRLRAFEWNGKLGAVGALVDDRTDDKRPRCFVRMLF